MRHSLLALVLLLFAGVLIGSETPDTSQGPGLSSDVLSLSLREGGVQVLSIDAGLEYAGFTYLVAGSSSGVFPGSLQDGLRVPLNYDSYTKTMLGCTNQPEFAHFHGSLDATGKAQAELKLPAGQVATLIGKVYHHAAVLIDSKSHKVVAATNPIELLLLP